VAKTGGSRSPFFSACFYFAGVPGALPAGAQSADAYCLLDGAGRTCCGLRRGPEPYGKVVIELANGLVWAFRLSHGSPTLLIRRASKIGLWAMPTANAGPVTVAPSWPSGVARGLHAKIMPVLFSCFLTFKT